MAPIFFFFLFIFLLNVVGTFFCCLVGKGGKFKRGDLNFLDFYFWGVEKIVPIYVSCAWQICCIELNLKCIFIER